MDFSRAFTVDKESMTVFLAERNSEVKFSLVWQEPAYLTAADCILVHSFFVEMFEENDFVRFKEAEDFLDCTLSLQDV